MTLFGQELIPDEKKCKITKKRKSIRLFGKDIVPERKKSAIKKTCRSSTALPPDPPPSALMEGRNLVFVTGKTLEQSDVDVHQNRFFIPKNEVLWGLLSEEERRAVKGGGGVEVKVVDTRGGIYSMRLKKWPSLTPMLLNCGWRKLVEDIGLMAEVDCVELWSFRADLKLCFALNVKRENAINN